jgi:type IV pilus assembly protein PilV
MQLSGKFHRVQRGVGLIEVLIAVLVLSFGMLGLAGLQAWSLRNNQSSLERGMATVQTHSIADSMRADRDTAINGGFDIGIEDDAPVVDDEDNPPSFRDAAIAAWRGALREALNPTATGSIDCNGAICAITVRWNDQRAQDGSATQQITTRVEL